MCPSDRHAPSAAKPALLDAFAVLDADGDGRIGPDDLRAFYAGFTGGPSASDVESEIQSMISLADGNKNGFVEVDEFERVVGSSRIDQTGEAALKDAFRVMDRDGDGTVGFSDLKAYLRGAEFPATDREIRTMLRMGGGDETKGVSFDEFVKILAVDLGCGSLEGEF